MRRTTRGNIQDTAVNEEQKVNDFIDNTQDKTNINNLQSKQYFYLNLQSDIKKLVQSILQKKENSYSYKEYKKVKFDNNEYKINDVVYVKAQGIKDYIADLQKIITIQKDNQIAAIIQVQWYFQKFELEVSEKYLEFISDNEIFSTKDVDYCYVNCLNGKAEVISMEQYLNSSVIKKNQYMKRASYNSKNKSSVEKNIFTPPWKEWNYQCLKCNQNLNPDSNFAQCYQCHKIVHFSCMNINSSNAHRFLGKKFRCPTCRNVSYNPY